jgi:hypothetical protein
MCRWAQNWNKWHPSGEDPKIPDYRHLMTNHPCYTPGKDLVLPAFRPPPLFRASPFLGGQNAFDGSGGGGGDGRQASQDRDILVLLRGDMGR